MHVSFDKIRAMINIEIMKVGMAHKLRRMSGKSNKIGGVHGTIKLVDSYYSR